MMTITLPPELNIPHPADMPIVELIRLLIKKGYRLVSDNRGNLTAVPAAP